MQMNDHEWSFFGGAGAKANRDEKAKELRAQGFFVKKTVIRNQIYTGMYGNVYYVRVLGKAADFKAARKVQKARVAQGELKRIKARDRMRKLRAERKV